MEIEQMRSNLIGLMKQFDKRWVEKYRAKTRDQKKDALYSVSRWAHQLADSCRKK